MKTKHKVLIVFLLVLFIGASVFMSFIIKTQANPDMSLTDSTATAVQRRFILTIRMSKKTENGLRIRAE